MHFFQERFDLNLEHIRFVALAHIDVEIVPHANFTVG